MSTFCKRVLCFFIVSMGFMPAYTQTYIFKNYGTNEGLPSSEVYSTAQDAQGYMWFATDRGVVKFDGYNFKTFTIEDGLPDNTIFELKLDNKQRLWFKSFTSDIGYIKNDSVHQYKYNHVLRTILPFQVIVNYFFDEQENLWLVKIANNDYRGDFVLFKVDRNGKVDSTASQTASSKLQILLTQEGENLVFGMPSDDEAEVRRFDTREKITDIKHTEKLDQVFSRKSKTGNGFFMCLYNQVVKLEGNKYTKVADAKPWVVNFFLDKEENIWICYRNIGFECYTAASGYKKVITGLQDKSVSSVYQDSEGGIWVTTLEEGVFYILPQAPLVVNESIGLKSKKIKRVVGVDDEIIVIGENGIIGLMKEGRKEIVSVSPSATLSSDVVCADNGIVYVSLDKKLPLATKRPQILVEISKNIHAGKNYIWANLSRDIRQYTLQGEEIRVIPFIKTARVMCVHEVSAESVLVGTLSGLYLYSVTKNKILPLTQHNKLYNYRINEISDLGNGYIAAATIGAGILIINTKNYELKAQISVPNGLPSVMCQSVLVQNSNTIWVGTNKGLCRIANVLDSQKRQVSIIDINNGLASNEINGLTIIGNKLWVSTASGVSIVSLSNSWGVVGTIPVYILGINAGEKKVTLNNAAQIKYNNNNVSFSFIGLNYQYAGKLVYRYRLKGIEEKWNTTTNLSVVYNSLPKGEYTFEVGVIKPNGQINASYARYSFTILPPFWQTTWFLIIIVLIILLIIYLIISYRVNFVRRQEKLKTDLNEFRDKALRGQMNPHFIYNSLNSIQNFILKNDTMESVSFLSKFSQLMRLTFNNTAQELVTLEKDIEALTLYVELENLRFRNKFELHIKTEGAIDFERVKVPPLILQPFVENAILHGLLTKEGKGNIWITLSRNPDSLEVTIKDDGIGRANARKIQERKAKFKTIVANTFSKRDHTGITATQSRIQQVWGKNIANNRLKIVDLYTENPEETGTLVHFFLPFYD